jgi:Flp pilus assembly protein TadD
LREAERLFEQAIEIDSSYALAWAGLGDVCGQLIQWGVTSDRDAVLKRGLDAARRAIALNPRLAEGHKAEALVLGLLGDEDAASTALERAVEVNSRYTPALGNLGVDRVRRADLAGAERWFRRSLDIEPHDPFTLTWVATLCIFTERRDEAESIITRVQQLSTDTFHKTLACMTRVALAFHSGRPGELERIIEEGRTAGVDASNLAMVEAFISARAGHAEIAKRHLDAHEQSGVLNVGGLMLGAAAALQLGEPKRAAGLFNRPLIVRLAQTFIRLESQLHALLDVEPFAPRQSAQTLVWPLEAPMIDATRHRVFADVRISSSRPDPSGS